MFRLTATLKVYYEVVFDDVIGGWSTDMCFQGKKGGMGGGHLYKNIAEMITYIFFLWFSRSGYDLRNRGLGSLHLFPSLRQALDRFSFGFILGKLPLCQFLGGFLAR
jgi:hypothetical protein